MDPVTHFLTGSVLANLGLAKVTPSATKLLILSSVVPDLDYAARLGGMRTYLKHHRRLSHSFVGLISLSAGLALAFHLAGGSPGFATLFSLSLIGTFSHVLLDLITPYGTQVLFPFRDRWYAWDLVAIVDPFMLLVLAAALLSGVLSESLSFIGALAACVIIASYCLLRMVYRSRALQFLKKIPGSHELLHLGAFPYFSPSRWLGVLEYPELFHVTTVNTTKDTSSDVKEFLKSAETGFTDRAKEAKTARTFLDFARFPWMKWRKLEAGWEVSWEDLRYKYFDRESFVARVLVSDDMNIIAESFRF